MKRRGLGRALRLTLIAGVALAVGFTGLVAADRLIFRQAVSGGGIGVANALDGATEALLTRLAGLFGAAGDAGKLVGVDASGEPVLLAETDPSVDALFRTGGDFASIAATCTAGQAVARNSTNSAWTCVDVGSVSGGSTYPPTADAKIVFITAASYDGAGIGGLSGADAKCQAEADSNDLRGTYAAWLSDSGSSPDTRFSVAMRSASAYQQHDGAGNWETVANGWADLTDGQIDTGIDRGADGTLRTPHVWTGTRSAGTVADIGQTCNDWTDNGSSTYSWRGEAGQFQPAWTYYSDSTCNNAYALYCFEQ